MRTGDIATAATLALDVLTPARDANWAVRAGDLDWSCRRTLDHIIDTLLLYASYVATQATQRRLPLRNGDDNATIPDLLASLDAASRIPSSMRAAAWKRPVAVSAIIQCGRVKVDRQSPIRASALSASSSHRLPTSTPWRRTRNSIDAAFCTSM